MKQSVLFMFLAASVFVLLLSGCGAMFMSDQATELVGLWYGDELEGSDYCYYDFRDDGRVYVTEFTEYMSYHNFWPAPIPIHYDYSVKDGDLKISYYAILKTAEFENIDSYSSDFITLEVLDSSGFSGLYYGDVINLTRVVDYTERDLAAKALIRAYIDGE